MKKPAIIVDLDGTLANCDHRMHYIQGPKKDWDSFFKEMKRDRINPWCADLVSKFTKDEYVVFLTGRPEKYRAHTLEWLDRWLLSYHNLPYFLFMRPDGDFTPDFEFKKHVYQAQIKTHFDVLFVLEDRQSVVDMWRSLGLVCLQCAPSDTPHNNVNYKIDEVVNA